MKTFKFALLGFVGFLLLNFYAGFLPYSIQHFPNSSFSNFFAENPWVWILFWLCFFPLCFFVARFLLNLKGLSSFGLSFKSKWKKHLLTGFAIGTGLKIFQYLLFHSFGRFEVAGMADSDSIGMILLFGTLIAVFPSVINDVAIRGFLLGYFRRLNFMKWFVVVSAVLYALDDVWNEGISFSNTIFSLVYGVSLGYTVYKTGAIWMSIGLHIGGNFIYQLLNGVNGNGLLVLENVNSGAIFDYINIAVALLLFPVIYFTLNFRKNSVVLSPPSSPSF